MQTERILEEKTPSKGDSGQTGHVPDVKEMKNMKNDALNCHVSCL